MNITFEAPFYTIYRHEKIESIEFFDQFVNWLKGEFDLYLMDDSDGLKVYYPSGFFSVKLFSKNENKFSVELKVKSKTLKSANQIASKIESVLINLKSISSN
jgi:hypothetical protein